MTLNLMNCVSMSKASFPTLHLNIRSLPIKYNYFIHYLTLPNRYFPVIALSESWLTEDTKDLFNVPNYKSPNYIRTNRIGGGVSLFVNAQYDFNLREELSLKFKVADIECLFVELSDVFYGKKVIVGVIY